jgi:hypothetical protein
LLASFYQGITGKAYPSGSGATKCGDDVRG